MKYPLVVFCLSILALSHPLWDLHHLDAFDTSILKLKNPPEFFVLDWQAGTVLKPTETALTLEVDSIGHQNIELWVDRKKRPVIYSSDISTPVCADGECKLMHIRLYWTLLGDYAGFDRFKDLPLTKHDHDEFTKADYQKLHRLLSDKNSVLKQRTIDELVEAPTQRVVNGVDALSGATIAEVKESVVSGALYSCYVAWHLVHSKVRTKIKTHTTAFANHKLLERMLKSNHKAYQMFALERLNDKQYVQQYQNIAKVFKKGTPLIRGFIIKNLPQEFWTRLDLQQPFWEAFSQIDIGSRSLLLNQLERAPESAKETIAGQLEVLTKNQLRVFLDHLSKEEISPSLIKKLKAFANDDKMKYSYLANQFLEGLDL